jgi:hypothetical protein
MRKRCSLVLFSPYALLYIFSLPHLIHALLWQWLSYWRLSKPLY